MTMDAAHFKVHRVAIAWRMVWTVATLVIVQGLVCELCILPVALVWFVLVDLIPAHSFVRILVFSGAIVPSYMLFAVCLLIASPVVVRLLGWHAPPDREMQIAAMEWPLLRWVRYAASIHVARVLAGTFFRGTPIWTVHLRLYGARLGRQVYVNSLSVSDYNLLECGDDVVIGGAVHLAGHTVENGIVKTAAVRLGDHVTVGLGSVIEIGVEIGSNCQIGALSFVPKHTRVAGGAIYAGIPARPIDEVSRST